MEHVTLYPTGWAAGYGAIAAFVRPRDHIVMDYLCHACLQQGAASATPQIKHFIHNDAEDLKARLQSIRAKDARNGIMVITEGLFAMESDAPDLAAFQDACRENGATLLVDVAHDLGALGPGGGGMIAAQGLAGKVDLVMGSFAKTFASNGGFLASHSPAAKQFAKYYGNPHMFSNALSPVQAAVASEAIRIVRSPEGDDAARAPARTRRSLARRLRGAGHRLPRHAVADRARALRQRPAGEPGIAPHRRERRVRQSRGVSGRARSTTRA